MGRNKEIGEKMETRKRENQEREVVNMKMRNKRKGEKMGDES